jgi:lactate dehydrogenase-like 2-hydroxyacid dehydrogenase
MQNKKWTVGVTHLIRPPFDPEQQAFFNKADIIYFDTRDENQFDKSDLEKLDAFLVWTPSIGIQTIKHLKKCKILVRYGVGYDKISLNILSENNIAFSNNPEYGPEDVADTAMALLLALQRRIVEHDNRSRNYDVTWQENHLAPVKHSKDMTLGIVGLGRIGTSMSLRLKAFGYRVIGYDPYISNGMFRAIGIERAESLSELSDQIDALSMHCPLTDETRGMINNEFLAQVKPGLIFINTARGPLVSDLDVIESNLRSGQLSAVGLDVLPVEPPNNHSLIRAWREHADWLTGRLLITPHNAFYSDHSMHECRLNAAQTAKLFLESSIHRNSVS